MNFRDTILYTSLAILVLAWTPPWLGPVIGKLEGRFFPVLDPNLTIASVAETGDYESRVAGTGYKARGDCIYVANTLRWYLGKPSRGIEVPAEFRDPPRERTGGLTGWEGIVVGLSEAQVRFNSYATVAHDCGWPWHTISMFYLSKPPERADGNL